MPHASHVRELRYGENPHQEGALYRINDYDPLSLGRALQINVSDVPPSYINLVDFDRAQRTLIAAAAALQANGYPRDGIAVAVKHGNACGFGASATDAAAFENMIEGDKLAVMGAVIATNIHITRDRAQELLRHGLEDTSRDRLVDGILAPGFDPGAIELLRRKNGKCPLLQNAALAHIGLHSLEQQLLFRQVRGMLLVQTAPQFIPRFEDNVVRHRGGGPVRNVHLERDLALAWAVGSTSTSNTIAIVDSGKLLANAVGQQDRVGAAELALKRAQRSGHDTHGGGAYSDSFFPFDDAPKVLIAGGVKGILTSSGSINDQQTIDACAEKGIDLYMVPDRLGRGFFGH